MRPAADRSTDRLATVVEAAEILGITPDAVRSRLRRGTLKRSPERGPLGEVLVVLPGDPSGTVGDQTNDASGDRSGTVGDGLLVERMASEIDHLRGQLEEAHAANRENRRIIAALTQRVPEVEIEASPGERGGQETASPSSGRGAAPEGSQEPAQRRSWWRRFFGFG